jgi:uncharacterized protein (DUF1501 family)
VSSEKIRCIECEEIELARVSDERPQQTLPIPYAALDGFPAGRSPSDLTRRRLLQFGVAGVASVYGPKALGWDRTWESVAAAADAPPPKCLLLLYLAGGNDGLNTIIPYQDADWGAYMNARTAIHRGRGATTTGATGRVGSMPFGGDATAPLAFSNVMVSKSGGGDNTDVNFGMDKLYNAGQLAVMPAVDAWNYTLSHFDNSDLWFNGDPGGVVSTGWLGRWVDQNGTPDNPLQAVSIDTALSKSIRTAKNPVCAIPSLSALGFTMNGSYPSPSGSASTLDVNPRIAALAGVSVGDGNTYLGRSRATYGVAVEAYNSGKAIGKVPDNPSYPNTGTLSTRLRLAAHLFGAKLGTRIITIHWGAFDTHSGQLQAQDAQLMELSRALGAFQADLTARGLQDSVSTLMFSEFGRRVGENGSAGTDHGAGGLMMAVGNRVVGGLGSEWPGVLPAQLVNGNVAVPTDFRSVYTSVIDEWLGGTASGSDVLGGSHAIPDLKRGDALSRLFKPDP